MMETIYIAVPWWMGFVILGAFAFQSWAVKRYATAMEELMELYLKTCKRDDGC